ncbi:IMPACT family [Chlorella sorokiniana]|uniref:IMPACT family n=1 Tax=Chlorella sorokiniana TaxID=3076 RepID=A0A2P6TF13_CHLSO|nr:IMPACT family [Chlorella sorokiniana]|eukprot:PRW32560.1 IMPACT family [Chlorella sorokiniana]
MSVAASLRCLRVELLLQRSLPLAATRLETRQQLQAFTTLAEPHSSEVEVKKSRFITHAWPCSSADEALELIASRRDPSATHNCWAYLVGQQYRSSDDGEPGGTAGRPILAAIEGEGLDGVAVLVIRFYGGIKLGAGGLVRAYGGAARDCLRAAAKRQMTPQVQLRLQVPFELLGPVYPLLEQHGARKEEESYDDAAGVSLVVRLEAGKAQALSAALADATSGRVQAETISARQLSARSQGDLNDDWLFNAPAELVCPLTLAPFIDPVLTSAGHVYERSAIKSHLERSNTDPLTRQPLLNNSLTPVYVLRSRALEYRESAAKACIQRVCSGSGAAEPVQYLRRAVELIADTGSHVQGLSQETIEFVLSHPSNAYDRIALQLFASGLFLAGYRDRAAAIYSTLLLQDADRVQQVELLRRCLSCWTEADCSAPAAAADDYVFEKLVALFDGNRAGLGWEELVDLAQHAALGDQFVLRLCEQLLFRLVPAPSSSCSGEEVSSAAGMNFSEKRLLLKYVHVLTDSLQRRQGETERRLQELERWRRQRGGGGRASSSGSLPDVGGGGRGGKGGLPRWARNPACVVVCMVATAALPQDHPASRILRAVPLLALLPPPAH